MSKAIETLNVYGMIGTTIRYCRPYVNTIEFKYAYYVDPSSPSHIELGTFEYPFKNIDPPAKEIFNFMYEAETDFTVYHKRGTTMKTYYGLMPLIILNIKNYTLTAYGDAAQAKPYVYITDHPYQWSDSSLFMLIEEYYDFDVRLTRGDWDSSEASTLFLKFNVFRSSLTIDQIDFQSIMFGDAYSNPLVFSFDALNQTVIYNDCYIDVDGAFHEAYNPISVELRNSHINLTNP